MTQPVKTNVARDLFLLAAVAFQNKKYDSAGALFASAMSSDDAPQFLELLNNPEVGSVSTSLVQEEPSMSLSGIARILSSSMSEDEDDESLSADAVINDGEDFKNEGQDAGDLDSTDSLLNDDEDEDEDEDSEDSDDMDSSSPGQTIVPSSISSSSPVRVKTITVKDEDQPNQNTVSE